MSEYITYHPEVEQGSDEWLGLRRGIICASEMKLIVTPKTLKAASNDAEKKHLYELLAQRITKYVEPQYVSEAMLRGHEEEALARELYSEKYEPITECGFVTNSRHGVTIGYSPDGLVGERGQWECKSRNQKFQVETIVDFATSGATPIDFLLQNQTGLIVTERDWCDLTSYHGGLPMTTMRIYPDEKVRSAIIEASQAFEARLQEKLAAYNDAVESGRFRLVPTERVIEEEMTV